MVYCETIENSKTWTCPKTGIWKIICIGGGGAGMTFMSDTTKEVGTSGGSTSFGSYLSAQGGMSGADINGNKKAVRCLKDYNWSEALGINGYNGAAAYGTQSGDFIGVGYGASGGASFKDNNTGIKYYNAGLPGDVKSVIMGISEGTSIACTIGTGGTVTTVGTGVIAAYPGKSGAIIVQYLGSEM